MISLSDEALAGFRRYLQAREQAPQTVTKYMRALTALKRRCGGALSEKEQLLDFKRGLLQEGYAPATVNGMLAAVNHFLRWAGAPEWSLRFLKVQRAVFLREEKELTPEEYRRLIRTANADGDERLALLVQTICATGIRVSELGAITVAALRQGRAEIRSKGKIRLVLLPEKLCRRLLCWCAARHIRRGAVFVTRSGRPLDRSNIWRWMKALAARAGVAWGKVFPHNLRHLFARTYYNKYRDLVRLADILGHSSVETTRIYTAHSCHEQRAQMDALPLLE